VTKFKRILEEATSSNNIVHIYEGGFREFVFARRVLRNTPGLIALFNFNFTDPWHLLFERRTITARFAVHLIRSVLAEMKPHFVALAETKETAENFSKRTKINFFEYPLFSTTNNLSADRKVKDRDFDVAYFPADEAELAIVLEANKKLLKDNKLVRSLIVPRWGLKMSATEIMTLKGRGIEYQGDLLSRDAYSSLYASAKIAVFPYEASYYKNTSSGRVLDAAAAGCYCIAPSESLPGKQIERQGWGSSYRDLAQEIDAGLRAWEGFTSTNVPTAEATLSTLIQLANTARANAFETPQTKSQISDLVLFVSLVFGTGFRSWAPRIFQGLRALYNTRAQT
jgi:hypothetical protein